MDQCFRTGTILWIATVLYLVWPAAGRSDDDIFKTYSCGSGFGFLQASISGEGNVTDFLGGDSLNHIRSFGSTGSSRSGYKVCYTCPGCGPFGTNLNLQVNDFGTSQSGLGVASVVAGTCIGTKFPCEVARFSTDGRIRVLRRITGNSFVYPCDGGDCGGAEAGLVDSDNDNIACNTLADCGNCGNKTLHVLTRVTNLTTGSLTNVAYVELVDFNIHEIDGGDWWLKTGASVTAIKDQANFPNFSFGMLLQSIVSDPATDVFTAGAYGDNAACDQNGDVLGPQQIDGEAVLTQFFGTLTAKSNTGNAFRVHYRHL
ncbi:MAG: hypothetical protein ACREQW_21525 [Candidatus Binatia bacterium]